MRRVEWSRGVPAGIRAISEGRCRTRPEAVRLVSLARTTEHDLVPGRHRGPLAACCLAALARRLLARRFRRSRGGCFGSGRGRHSRGVRSDRGRHRGRFLTSLGGPGFLCDPSVPCGLRCLRRLGSSPRRSRASGLGHGRSSRLGSLRGPRHLCGYRGWIDWGSARHGRRAGGWSLGLPRLGSFRFGQRAFGDLRLGDRRPPRAWPLMPGPPAVAHRTVAAQRAVAVAHHARAKPGGTGPRLTERGSSMTGGRMTGRAMGGRAVARRGS